MVKDAGIPTGYKQTDVGIIPVDWKVKPLKDISEKIMVGIASAATHAYREAGIVLLRNQNIKDGYLDDNDILYIAEEYEVLFKNKRLRAGDLLTARTGYPGTTCIIPNKYEGAQSFTTLITRPKQQELQSDFLCHYINSERGKAFFESNQIGGGQKNVNAGSLQLMPIPIPPSKEEQQAIASTLSDVDALITALEELLTKKRNIKQGAMQQLLTGKKRLPGFTEKWEIKNTDVGVIPVDWNTSPLINISSMNGRIGWQGLKQSEFTMKPDDPFLITGMNFKDGEIRWEEVYHIPYNRYNEAKDIQLRIGDVLMTKDGTIGKLLYIDQIPYPRKASLNSHLLVFRPLHNIYIPKYLFYQLDSKMFKNHIELEKSGTTFFGITQESIGNYKAYLPSLPEQQAIATTLSDMDAEIKGFEQKRDKYKAIKQGMMQELLTGKTRLI